MAIAQTERGIAAAYPLWRWGYAIAAAIAIAAALTAPLAAYVFMIALFGLPHVLCELRYCDERFSARAPRAALALVGVLLAALAGLRIAQGSGLIGGSLAVPAELGVGLCLVATAVRFMPRNRVIGVIAGIAIACGAALAPIATFLVFAWLHNLTPLGFISEILPAQERKRAILLLCIPFVVLPLLVASGWPQALVQHLTGYAVIGGPSLFRAGRYPISAFLTGAIAFPNALTLFSAALVAQAMHYFSVIVVMPQLLQRRGLNASGTSLVRWPSWRHFYIAVGLFGLTMLIFNAADYRSARVVYGLAAAMHSWAELPIFLIALGFGFNEVRREPRQPATIQS